MPFINLIATTAVLFFTSIAGLHFGPNDDFKTISYEIEDKSELSISGTSNVNKFCCTATENFSRGEIAYQWASDHRIKVTQGILQISSQKLDCGGKQINKDFYKTLRADEFPYIDIILNHVTFTDKEASEPGWDLAIADTDMIIAGCTNHKILDIAYRKIGENRYEVKSTTSVCITDFGIEPPKALFGLIQVDKDVDINMYMFISLHPDM